jgi:V8-like Glu-specific endopeptidase
VRRIALFVAVSAVAALSGLNMPADAAPGGRSDEHRRIVDYWTPERQANAIPRDMSPDPKKGKPGTGGGTPTTSVIGAAWTKGETVSITTGKVFFTLGGVNYVCSASAVDSAGGNLVLTAGHCVHDGDGGPFATNWMFSPRYNSGDDPVLGRWTASSLHTTAGWANAWPTSGSGFNDDAGFAVIRPKSGQTLKDALVGQGAKIPTISFDGWNNKSVYWSFGYPAARPYTGTTLTYCVGTTRLDRDALDTMALPCNMTGGSSGGPWLVEYTPGNPVIESVNSYGYSSMKDTMFGPLFGAPEQSAYNAAKAAGTSCTTSTTTACLPAA